MGKVWETAGVARTEFAEMIETLDEGQLAADTWCAGWTPKHVLAHLVGFVDVPLPKFFFNIARNKFDFDAASVAAAEKAVQERTVDDMVKSLKAKATQSSKLPSFPEGLTVADVAVHTQDVRRGLGLEGQLDDGVLAGALTFLTTDPKAQKIFEIPNLDGLSFEATDTGFTSGSGQQISGAGDAIITALMGRPTLDELEGEGVAELRNRL